ncbi:Predicted GTPase subunit of the pre-mRNA cleavage complex [Pseudomonas syringae pv. actinidiae]|uniref:Predicted GTPase subunit of the pre-mRNA cleavage complex n=1 Tax=Pseudomonas syringae pv. actinidiae TaxID=103796 RepID=A0AAN4TMD0_PSESF|nr:Predicted GTPase subunit of the pre-mRNA cleavage complex [Pseudomonas syringae pv. actinidiae]
MFSGERHLHGAGRTDGCAHFQRNCLRQFFLALDDQLMNPADDLCACLGRGAGPARKGRPSGCNGAVYIGSGAAGNVRDDFLSRRVDHRNTGGAERRTPVTINVKFLRRVRINAMAVQGLCGHPAGSLER